MLNNQLLYPMMNTTQNFCFELKIQMVIYVIHVIKNYWVHIIYKQLIDYFLFLFFYCSSLFLFISLNQFK